MTLNNNFCELCPRRCKKDRTKETGFCGSNSNVKIARVGLHNWEEPCISYGKGSGTVFFSGCSLKCVFCQNYKISSGNVGKEIEPSELSNVFLSVAEMGAVNINLVNPTHYGADIAAALERIKDKLKIPIIYNTGGYDRVETLKRFNGLVDIYLPDIKYRNSKYSQKYSGAADYFEVASKAVTEMFCQTGYPQFDSNGHMLKGVLPRHLVMPSLYRDSFEILDWLSQNFNTNKLYVSIMRQYFPTYKAFDFPEIARKLTTLEYNKVLDHAASIGITKGYSQEKSSAKEEYVPDFDY